MARLPLLLALALAGCAHSRPTDARLPTRAASRASDAELAAVWGPERRTRVDQRARAIQIRHLEVVAEHVVEHVDRLVARWLGQRIETCRRARGIGRRPRRLRDDRPDVAANLACEEAALPLLDALATHLEAPDAAMIDHLEGTVDDLEEALDRCGFAETATLDIPLDAWVSIERAAIASRLGADEDALATADAALAGLRVSGPADAERRWLLAEAALRSRDFDRARRELADEDELDARPLAARIRLHLALAEDAEALVAANLVREHFHHWGNNAAVHALLAAAAAFRRVGDFASAEQALTEALDVEQLGFPDRTRRSEGEVLEALGVVAAARGDFAAAIAWLRQAVTLRQRLLGRHPDSATSHHHLAAAYAASGRLEVAEESYRYALSLRMEALGDDPLTARTYNNLGNLAFRLGDLDEALRLHTEARRIRVAAYGDDHAETATSDLNLGMVLLAQGDAAGARDRFEHVLAIRRRVLGDAHPYTAIALNDLGLARAALGDPDGALAAHREALAIRVAFFGEDHLESASSHQNIAALLLERGDLAGAKEHVDAALAARRRHLPPEHPELRSSEALAARIERAARPLSDEGWSL
ncbi:MAG: tetratricopeptide repeat protein [Myxococcales bacterium]|nr:tetratricopeptide repeat protein [Myxococcales bacterium]MCB9704012.1 tetratricopeptide repeat protein [Myxococcales bacterium]